MMKIQSVRRIKSISERMHDLLIGRIPRLSVAVMIFAHSCRFRNLRNFSMLLPCSLSNNLPSFEVAFALNLECVRGPVRQEERDLEKRFMKVNWRRL